MTNAHKKFWGKELSKGLISIDQLQQINLINNLSVSQCQEIKNNFDIRVPQSFLEEIIDNNLALKKQFIPSEKELIFFPQELDDPIGDEVWSPVEGLTHRYPDRVLLKPTYMCAGYCRFCFRRYKVSHSEYNLNEESYLKAINYIQNNSSIVEVILTGGDPLTLVDKKIEQILTDLCNISHVKWIRFHTRIPSLLPSRITPELIAILKKMTKPIWIATHMNHSSEFNSETKNSLEKLTNAGIPVLLQSVLLKGVNDTQQDLIDLFRIAVENKVKPYYLHYPDLAKGTSHFRIPLKEAIALFKGLRGKISGLCLPHFIVDIPGGKGKIALNPHTAFEISPGLWKFESPLDGSFVEIRYDQ